MLIYIYIYHQRLRCHMSLLLFCAVPYICVSLCVLYKPVLLGIGWEVLGFMPMPQ